MKKYRHFGYEERCQLHALVRRGVKQAEIAATLGFSQATISRELRRNRGGRGYRFKQAQHKTDDRQHEVRGRPRKLTKVLSHLIAAKLRQERWSPQQISAWLKKEHDACISHERIYQMIWQDKYDGGTLWRCLRRRGKRYNKRSGLNAGRGLIPNRIDISERPAIVESKKRLGDWEGDTVVGSRHRGALLTHVERKSKLTKIARLPRATAAMTHKATVRDLKPIRRFVETITYDNGKEFAGHQLTAKALRADIYFATPYHAWERGLNENTNGLIRDFFPKGTDFTKVSNAEVAKVERLLNSRPRVHCPLQWPVPGAHQVL